MKHNKLIILILGFLFFGCNQASKKTIAATKEKLLNSKNDDERIQNLIRKTLNWAVSTKSIALLPTITDSKDSIHIRLDLDKHKHNLEKLKNTGFFATEFIENYNQIILTLDKGLKNGKYEPWLVGDLQTFIFANDVDPWTMSQDVPYDKPNPFDFIKVRVINAKKGEAIWKWGNLKRNTGKEWEDFTYKFKVVKEHNVWKISYLQGFDLEESTKKG